MIAAGHQRADGGGSGIKNVDIVAVNNIADPLIVRVVGHPFEHHAGGAVGQRTVDQISMPGNPAHIGGAPVHLPRVVIEGQLVGQRGIDHVAAGGVQYTLWLPGGAGGIEDE